MPVGEKGGCLYKRMKGVCLCVEGGGGGGQERDLMVTDIR